MLKLVLFSFLYAKKEADAKRHFTFEDGQDKKHANKDIEDIDVEESEDEKKEHFFSSLIGLNEALIIDKTTASIAVIDGVSSYSFDIQLPPPEYTI